MTQKKTRRVAHRDRYREDNAVITESATTPGGDLLEQAERYRHVKRGTVYEVVGEAELQTVSGALVDGSALLIYRGDDGKLWAREEGEFHDGRFELLKPAGDGGEA